jgi:protein-tyrosine phosphatase
MSENQSDFPQYQLNSESHSNQLIEKPKDYAKSYFDYIYLTSRVLKDKVWYGLWHFDLFEKVDRCYANESYYSNISNLISQSATHVIDNIYLGSAFNAVDYTWLKLNKIDIIVNVAPGISNFYPDEFQYYNINVEDLNNASMMPHFEAFYRLLEQNPTKRVFVHCFAGKSRSASLVLYYLVKKYRWTVEHAINFLKKQRDTININCTFIEELTKLEKVTNPDLIPHAAMLKTVPKKS